MTFTRPGPTKFSLFPMEYGKSYGKMPHFGALFARRVFPSETLKEKKSRAAPTKKGLFSQKRGGGGAPPGVGAQVGVGGGGQPPPGSGGSLTNSVSIYI